MNAYSAVCAVTLFMIANLSASGAKSEESKQYYDCAGSAEAAVSGVCRTAPNNGTIAMLDYEISDRLFSLLKFDGARYKADWRYKARINEARQTIRSLLSSKFELGDRRSILRSEPPRQKTVNADILIGLLEDFDVSHVGCNFTRETEGDVQISRSFLVVYTENGDTKFAAVHVEVRNPQKLHEQIPSARTPDIVSLSVWPFVPGFHVSNEILRVHILDDPSVQCERIIALMDQREVDAVREQIVDQR